MMKFLLLALFAAVVAGCSDQAQQSAKPAAPPPAPLAREIQEQVAQRGKLIVAETFGLLSSNLLSAIQQSGVSNALPFCSLSASPLTASMAQKHGVTIRRFSHKPRNPLGQADAAELSILSRFESGPTGTNPPPPVVTNFNAQTATFFAPIVLTKELCLQCHGEPGKDIAAENLAVIQRLYPNDAATGFKLGQLRGAWRIDFPLASLSAGR